MSNSVQLAQTSAHGSGGEGDNSCRDHDTPNHTLTWTPLPPPNYAYLTRKPVTLEVLCRDTVCEERRAEEPSFASGAEGKAPDVQGPREQSSVSHHTLPQYSGAAGTEASVSGQSVTSEYGKSGTSVSEVRPTGSSDVISASPVRPVTEALSASSKSSGSQPCSRINGRHNPVEMDGNAVSMMAQSLKKDSDHVRSHKASSEPNVPATLPTCNPDTPRVASSSPEVIDVSLCDDGYGEDYVDLCGDITLEMLEGSDSSDTEDFPPACFSSDHKPVSTTTTSKAQASSAVQERKEGGRPEASRSSQDTSRDSLSHGGGARGEEGAVRSASSSSGQTSVKKASLELPESCPMCTMTFPQW